MEWMKIPMKGTFEKLWGKIEGDLTEGTYVVDVQNDLRLESYQVQKSLVIRQLNMFGGENPYLFFCFF